MLFLTPSSQTAQSGLAGFGPGARCDQERRFGPGQKFATTRGVVSVEDLCEGDMILIGTDCVREILGIVPVETASEPSAVALEPDEVSHTYTRYPRTHPARTAPMICDYVVALGHVKALASTEPQHRRDVPPSADLAAPKPKKDAPRDVADETVTKGADFDFDEPEITNIFCDI